MKKDEINNLVFKGLIPISFLNSEITINEVIELSIKINDIEDTYINNRYNQFSILEGFSNTFISKIYELD